MMRALLHGCACALLQHLHGPCGCLGCSGLYAAPGSLLCVYYQWYVCTSCDTLLCVVQLSCVLMCAVMGVALTGAADAPTTASMPCWQSGGLQRRIAFASSVIRGMACVWWWLEADVVYFP